MAKKPKTVWRSRIVGHGKVAPGELVANPLNWRTHPRHQKQALEGVLAEVGWVQSVIVNRTSGKLVDGHLRVELALAHGEAEVDVVYVELDEREERLVLASLDPLGALATTDEDMLRQLLDGLDAPDALAELFASLLPQETSDGLTDPDDVPAPPDDPVTQPGDLWILGDHRLLCGDAGSVEDLDRLLAGEDVDLLNTDLPYNVKVEPRSNNAIASGMSASYDASYQDALEGAKRKRGAKAMDAAGMHHAGFDVARGKTGKTHHQKFDVERHPEKAQGTTRQMRAKDRPLINDFVSDEAFDALLLAWFGNASRVMGPGRSFYVWGGYANVANYPPAMKAVNWYFSQAVIWVKEHPVLTRKDFMGNHEWAFYGWKHDGGHRWFGPNNATDVWSVKKVSPNAMVHLTEKPVELARRAIEYSSLPGEVVLDLFGGSGSTLIACEQMDRKGHLMELDPAYCDVIVERWKAFTGKEPRREGSET